MNKKLKSILCAAMTTITVLAGFTGCKSGQKEIVFWTPFTGPDGENMTRMVERYLHGS